MRRAPPPSPSSTPIPALDPVDALASARAYAAGLDPHAEVTGTIPGQLAQGDLIDQKLTTIELATVALILLITLIAYRSVGAPLVVLATIAIALPITAWSLGTLAQRSGRSLPQEIDPVVIALMLGIITDYAIFYLSGVRGRLAAGAERRAATRATYAEYSPLILTSAVILACSLLALLVSSLGFFRDLGPALALTVGIGMVVAVTFIPALLAMLGSAVFWPARPQPKPDEEPAIEAQPRFTGRMLSRRWAAFLCAAVCLAALGVAGFQLQSLRLGFGQITDLSDTSPPHRAAIDAGHGFRAGILQPTSVVVQQPGVGTTGVASLVRMQTLIAQVPGVAGTVGPADDPLPTRYGVLYSPDGNAARIVVVFDHDALGASGIDDLNRLRNAMPGIVHRSGLEGARISYAGDTALARDAVDDIYTQMVRVLAVVLLVNLLLLMLFLRSIAAPLYLLASSALAVAASLGLTAWVFQTLLGYGQLTYYVPFVVAVLLIALGSDYNVFVVGRIWHEARRRPLPEAVAVAAPDAARTIRSAGVILAASFAVIAVIPLRSFREIAFAMAVGVLIETFVVRSVIVPSLITIFGTLSGWPGRRLRHQSNSPTEVS